MDNHPEKKDGVGEIEEGYAVAPLSPEVTKTPPLKVPPRPVKSFILDPPEKEPPFQYGLSDLFLLMTSVAVLMSIISVLVPSGINLNNVAGVTGIGALISLLLLVFWPPDQPLLRLGWWILFGLYMLACIASLFFGR